MEKTLAKTSPIPRSGDRLVEALSTLAALLDRTINEVKNLDPEFQTRLHHAVQNTELRVREEVANELNERFQQELQTVLETARIEFETERERLTAAMNHSIENAARLQGDRENLSRDLNQAIEATGKLEAERGRLVADINRLREETQAEVEKARRMAEAAAAAQAQRTPSRGTPAEVAAEVERVESKIRDISAVIEDPVTELTVVIRKNVERSELDSYLKGIRFVVDRLGK